MPLPVPVAHLHIDDPPIQRERSVGDGFEQRQAFRVGDARRRVRRQHRRSGPSVGDHDVGWRATEALGGDGSSGLLPGSRVESVSGGEGGLVARQGP